MRWYGATLVLVLALAFTLRTAWAAPHVLDGDTVTFLGVDPYYHMRLVEWMDANNGRFLIHDAYGAYPDGVQVGYRPLLHWLIVAGGRMTPFDLDHVAAFVPPLLGALTLLPVYALGRLVFKSRVVGLVGALLVAVMPSEFLHRSILGFTDHHVLEVLLTLSVLVFLLLGLRGRWVWALAAGVSHGLLFLAWHGAVFLLGVVGLWFVGAFTYQHFTGGDKTRLLRRYGPYVAGVAVISVPFLVYIGAAREEMLAVGLAVMLPVVMWPLYRWIPQGRRGYLGQAGLVVAMALAAFLLTQWPLARPLVDEVGRQLHSIFWGFGSSIVEAQPTTWVPAWRYYGLMTLVMPFGATYAIKHRLSGLFLVWTGVMLLASFGQRRWGYYAIVPVSLLSGYAILLAGRAVVKPARASLYVVCILAIVLVSLGGIQRAVKARPFLDQPMYNAMVWLRENTPEPFGDADAYYTEPGTPEYGILSWWDYGHWVIRIARRVPLSSPTWQDVGLQKYLVAQTPQEAEAYLEGLAVRYVILTRDMVEGKFYPIAERMGANVANLGEIHAGAMSVRLWNGELPERYRLVFHEGPVKVFERTHD